MPIDNDIQSYHSIYSLEHKQSKANHSLYTKYCGTELISLLIYVEDIVLAGNSSREIAYVRRCLDEKFGTKDLSTLRYFLELEIKKPSSRIFPNQRKYAPKLLKNIGFLRVKPSSIPFEPKKKLIS